MQIFSTHPSPVRYLGPWSPCHPGTAPGDPVICPGERDAISGPRPTYPTDPTNPPRSVRMAPGDSKHPGVGGLTQILTPRGTL